MDDEVLLPDRSETIAAMVADALRVARIVWNEFEIWPVQVCELRHLVEREHAVDLEYAIVGDTERALHETAQLWRHERLDVEPDHRAAAAALEGGFEQPHEIFGFF